MSSVEEFDTYRKKMNQKILDADNKVIKRIFNLDTNVYTEGALPSKTKEMLGLMASLSLRCDDCVKYHIKRCYDLGLTKEELFELFAVGTVVSGTILIPHLRRATEYWEELSK